MKVYDPDGLRVFFGPNSQHFKEGTLKALSQKFDYPIKAGRYDPIEFSDGEMKVQLLESNRGRTAFLVMSTEVLERS